MVALFLTTLLLTMVVVGGILYLLLQLRSPTYRIQRSNVICLLRLVLTGQATENDWSVFISYPIRHSAQLESVRLRCLDIDQSEYLGRSRQAGREGYLLTRKGLKMLEEILEELECGGNDSERE